MTNDTKALWTRPELTVLARSTSETAVLTGCKDGSGGSGPSGPNDYDGYCYGEVGPCAQCDQLLPS